MARGAPWSGRYKFLACGILEHGFARIRCDACAHEYLLAFSCKCRDFCPSCHAKRLAIWAQWLDATLLAAKRGFPAEAKSLAERGVKVAKEPGQQDRFRMIASALERDAKPAPASAAPATAEPEPYLLKKVP